MTLKRINRGRGHSYTIDGEKVDGVTTLIGGGVPKPALVPWAAGAVGETLADCLEERDGHWYADQLKERLADVARRNRRTFPTDKLSRTKVAEICKAIPYDERDTAANRGTAVHALGHQLAAGAEVTVPDELVGHVDSYVKFLDDYDVDPVLLETTVGSRRWRYCGTLDLIADLHGVRWLLDIKTNRSGPFGETALQLAAYRFAEVYLDVQGNEQPMIPVDKVGVVWVRADGYDLYEFDAGPATFEAFLHVAATTRWLKDIAPTVKSDALRPEVAA